MVLESTLGGTRKYVFDLLNEFDKDEFEITFAYATRRADADFFIGLDALKSDHRVKLIELPMVREIHPFFDLLAFGKLWWLILTRKFDVVHCHSSKAGFLGRLATKLAAPWTPTIYSPNAMAVNIHPIYRYLEKFAGFFTTHLIAAADSEKNEILSHRILSESKISVISLGVQIPNRPRSNKLRKELKLSDQTVLVASIARCTKQKDPMTFLRAGKILADLGHDIHFAWLGNGDMENEVKQFIREQDCPGSLSFIGHRPDTQELLSGIDIFGLASLYESFGYVSCEAMAWELPVVATDVVGTQSVVVNKETGFLVPPNDPAAFATKVWQLAQNAELRSQMGRKGKERVERYFSVKKMARETTTLYRQLLERQIPYRQKVEIDNGNS